jgi:alpha-beta hydrolase superfamily lysophospholipase
LVETRANYIVESFIASDGYRCHYRHYAPPAGSAQAARAHVVCIHGIQSHAGWYEHSCRRLSEAGYAVSFLDRRGAGLNMQDRGDTPHYRRLLDDIAEFLQVLRYPDRPAVQTPLTTHHSPLTTHHPTTALPIFLLGISWGGKLAVALPRRHPGQVAGLVLLCPGFYPRVGPALGERLRIAWARLASPRRLFPVPLQDPELFTATPRWQQFIRDDPISLRQATARFFVASIFLDRALRSVPPHVHVPVLLLLAGKDRIIDNERTRQYVDQFATKDKEIRSYPEAAHTLEFEADPEPMIRDVQEWLDRHSPTLPV